MLFKKTCWYCGKRHKGKYCPKCGAANLDEKRCPNCGYLEDGKATVCSDCGYSFKPMDNLTSKEKMASKANKIRNKYKNVIKSFIYIVVLLAVAYMVFNYVIMK